MALRERWLNEIDGETSRAGNCVLPSAIAGAYRGQNSIPLPLLSFATFVLPLLPGAALPTDEASPENGLRRGAAFACWDTAES